MSGKTTDRTAARARLALRAERAFGVRSIALPSNIERLPPPAHEADGPLPVAVGGEATQATRQQIAEMLSAPPESSSKPAVRPAITALADTPTLASSDKYLRLQQLDENEVRGCRLCRLCEQRTHTVFGEGSPDARLVFIGEGPGQNEDQTGRPFVGRAGELLNKMISGMGLQREDVYIANVVKCRPPGNREPAPDEVATCTPYLERQLEIIHPGVIVTLGKPAMQHMLRSKEPMSRMRGQWQSWRGIKLMPTFHPAYLLRSYTRANREMVWSDLQQAMQVLGLPIRSRPRS